MCRITLYSLNKDDDTHIPNLIAMNLQVHSFFLSSFAVKPACAGETCKMASRKNIKQLKIISVCK